MSSGRAWLRTVLVVAVKELTDGLRDRRSLISALLFPMFGPVLIAAMFTTIVEDRSELRTVTLPVAGAEHAPALIEHLEVAGIEIEQPPEDPQQAVHDAEVELVLVVPEDYEERFRASQTVELELVVDASRRDAQTSVQRVTRQLEQYSGRLGSLRLLARGVHPEVARPLSVEELDVATPERRAANILTMVPMFVMLASFIGGMFLATDSTAGERERRSLEPLLLNPVSRQGLAVGKWLATSMLSMTSVVITGVGSMIALSRIPLHEVGLALDLGATQALGGAAALLPLCFLAAGVQLVVASFARSFREAQTYLSVLTLVPTIPGVYLTLEPLQTQAWMMAVPILGQQALVMDLLRGEGIPAWFYVMAGAISLGLGAVCVQVAGWLLGRERMISGS